MKPSAFDVIVLGAGGAGLFCAFTAGQMGKRVLVLDHADRPGKKILISGGGRCNFTNTGTEAARFVSRNPHFAKSALSRYTPRDFVDLVERHGIAWHHKTLGQLFCDGSAKAIVKMLLDECEAGGVRVAMESPIDAVDHADGRYTVRSNGRSYQAPALVIATGGPSIPKMGATGFAYDLGRQFGCKIVEPRPALVPFTLPGTEALFRELSGVATDAVVRAGKVAFREAVLLTHKGLSGPAILQASSYWRHGEPIAVDFLPDAAPDVLLRAKAERPKASLSQTLAGLLPNRLADALAQRLGADGALSGMKDAALKQYESTLRDWAFRPNGTEGFAKAEVTAGGVSTDALSSKTMEAKSVLGLYVIGEAVDVTGWLGGYNFQWAWASGYAAGMAIAARD
ncbi:MAG: NAD(P)/FAD-dependent oxidoreductase [Pseudomonadota bacterium]